MVQDWISKILKPAVLFGFWIILSGEISLRIVLTGLISVLSVMFISEHVLKRYASSHVLIRHHYHILWFIGIFLIEIFLAAYQHIQRVLSGEDRSVIFELELDIEDEFAIALIANAITLTPGTLTMQVKESTLTILGFAETEEEVEQIRHVVIDKFQKPFLGGGRHA